MQQHDPIEPIELERFDALTKAEQVRVLQDLWDRISDGPGELPAPEEHLTLVEERLTAWCEDEARGEPGHSAYRVLDRLQHGRR